MELFIKNLESQLEDSNISKINKNTELTQIDGWDSMTILMVIGMAKTEYSKSINATEINKCKTVNDLYNIILNKNE